MSGLQAELLPPLASLEWKRCTETPFGMREAQAVCLPAIGNVYIGGGRTSSPKTDYTILCFRMNSWKTIKSPTRLSALTTYQGKLVLVGGEEEDLELETNKLWILQVDDKWTDELPPMPTPRYGASAVNSGSHLIVAGGRSEQQHSDLNVVEVFDGRQWTKAESLPSTCSFKNPTLHNGECYLVGGERQSRFIFSATVDSLISTAGSSESEDDSVWKTIPEAPLVYSSIAMYGDQLLAIGGRNSQDSPQSAIYSYISGTQSWVHAWDLPEPIHSTCSIIFPSGELLIVGGCNWSGGMWWSSSVFKAALKENTDDKPLPALPTAENTDDLPIPSVSSVDRDPDPPVSGWVLRHSSRVRRPPDRFM